MNCRPGDLALVLPPGRWTTCPACGQRATTVKPDTIVRVTQHDGQAWLLAEPIEGQILFSCGTLVAWRCRGLADEILRPLRDPGDDAVDEIVKLVGAAPMTAPEILAWSGAL